MWMELGTPIGQIFFAGLRPAPRRSPRKLRGAKGMWRGSVERVSRSPERCGLIEARVRTQIRYLHLPRSRRRARAEHHNLMFRSNSVTDGGPTAVAAATLVAD